MAPGVRVPGLGAGQPGSLVVGDQCLWTSTGVVLVLACFGRQSCSCSCSSEVRGVSEQREKEPRIKDVMMCLCPAVPTKERCCFDPSGCYRLSSPVVTKG